MNIGYLFPSNKLELMSTTRSKDKHVTYEVIRNTSGYFLVWLKEDTSSEDHCFREDLWKWKWVFNILWLQIDIFGEHGTPPQGTQGSIWKTCDCPHSRSGVRACACRSVGRSQRRCPSPRSAEGSPCSCRSGEVLLYKSCIWIWVINSWRAEPPYEWW